MADLKTDYLDDILDVSVNEQRKYDMVTNSDGTISLVDQTVYTQHGSSFGARDMNDANTLLNEVNRNLNGFRFGEETDSETGEVTRGYYVYDEEAGTDVLVPFNSGFSPEIVVEAIYSAAISQDKSQTNTFTATEKGTYMFICSVRPPYNSGNGTLAFETDGKMIFSYISTANNYNRPSVCIAGLEIGQNITEKFTAEGAGIETVYFVVKLL